MRRSTIQRNAAEVAQRVQNWLTGQQIKKMQEAQHRAMDAKIERMERAFADFPHWINSPRQESELRRELYKALLEVGISDVVPWADAILNLLRRAAE